MQKIAIHSVPRSGSSWLGEIINSSPEVSYAYQPLFSYEFKSALDENSSLSSIDQFYKNLSLSNNDFITQSQDRKEKLKPIFEKSTITHIAYKEVRYHYILENMLIQDPNQKVIGLIRDPLAVLKSWKNAPREFRVDLKWDFEKEWNFAKLKNEEKKEEYFGFEKWKETATYFEKLKNTYPDNFLCVFYSDLLNDTESEVFRIFEFLNIPITKQTLNFIKESKTKEKVGTYSVYKNKPSINHSASLPENIVKAVKNDCSRLGLSKYINE